MIPEATRQESHHSGVGFHCIPSFSVPVTPSKRMRPVAHRFDGAVLRPARHRLDGCGFGTAINHCLGPHLVRSAFDAVLTRSSGTAPKGQSTGHWCVQSGLRRPRLYLAQAIVLESSSNGGGGCRMISEASVRRAIDHLGSFWRYRSIHLGRPGTSITGHRVRASRDNAPPCPLNGRWRGIA